MNSHEKSDGCGVVASSVRSNPGVGEGLNPKGVSVAVGVAVGQGVMVGKKVSVMVGVKVGGSGEAVKVASGIAAWVCAIPVWARSGVADGTEGAAAGSIEQPDAASRTIKAAKRKTLFLFITHLG